jgi:hypothetical protein
MRTGRSDTENNPRNVVDRFIDPSPTIRRRRSVADEEHEAFIADETPDRRTDARH